MKVLHLSAEKTWRGGEQQLAYLIAESTKLGVQNYVSVKKGSAFEGYCKQNNIEYFSLGFKNELDFRTAIGVKRICKQKGIDLVHIHSSHAQAMAVQSVVFGNKTPLVLSRKVDFPIKDNALSKWKFNHKSIKKIICVSDAIRVILNKDLKNKNICSVVHDGIDLKRFHYKKGTNVLRKEFNISSEKKIVANISALAPHKYYRTFIETAELTLKEDENFHFFAIGDGSERTIIEALIKEKGLEENITLTGFRKDIPDVFPDIDVFLMTSETEGLGSTLLDAAAHKIPIVSTNAGGIPEFVEDKITGLLANVYDAENLAKNLLEISTNTALAERLTTAAYSKLVEGFTKEIMAKETLEVYQEVLKQKG